MMTGALLVAVGKKVPGVPSLEGRSLVETSLTLPDCWSCCDFKDAAKWDAPISTTLLPSPPHPETRSHFQGFV